MSSQKRFRSPRGLVFTWTEECGSHAAVESVVVVVVVVVFVFTRKELRNHEHTCYDINSPTYLPLPCTVWL